MSTEVEHPITSTEARRLLLVSDLKVVGGVVAAIFVGGWVALAAVSSVAATTAEAKTGPLGDRITAVESRLDVHILDSRLAHDLSAKQLERVDSKLDALYDHMISGRPQPLFEHDGGVP